MKRTLCLLLALALVMLAFAGCGKNAQSEQGESQVTKEDLVGTYCDCSLVDPLDIYVELRTGRDTSSDQLLMITDSGDGLTFHDNQF